MNLKPTLLAVGLAVACGGLAIAPAALAAVPDGTITFSGNVIASTCTVTGGGASTTAGTGGNFTVALPNTSVNALTLNGIGAYTASATAFTMKLAACPTGVKVGAQFYGTNVDTTTGNGTLKGTGVTGVDVQLLDGSSTPLIMTTASPAGNANVSDQTILTSPATSATLSYTAQYYATTATPGSGAVSTTVNYLINYQ